MALRAFSAALALHLATVCLAADTEGTFSVLSYNVAGLPELLSSGNPEVNTPLISPRLAPYNVINVQEDFNYHAALYANDNHAFRTPTSGGVPFGSGLNMLSDFQFIDLERVTWNDCNLNSGDCLTPKGFTFVRARISDGLWVDVYNLHTDAGADSGDMNARQSNLAQVGSFVSLRSPGFPVVVMGDTNSRYTTAQDSQSLHTLLSSAGLTDAWVSTTRGGNFPASGTAALTCPFPFPAGTSQQTMVACEVVDKILVRGTTAAQLVPQTYTNENDAFVNASGYPLSDHYSISSRLQWTLSSLLRMSDSLGGPHGTAFNDISSAITSDQNVPIITLVTLRGGARLDAVSYTLRFANGGTEIVSHGGTGGNPVSLQLDGGEHVVSISLCQGQRDGQTRIFWAQFETNEGRTLSAGTQTDACSAFGVPTDPGNGGDWGLVGFWGRSGDEVDRLAGLWGAVY